MVEISGAYNRKCNGSNVTFFALASLKMQFLLLKIAQCPFPVFRELFRVLHQISQQQRCLYKIVIHPTILFCCDDFSRLEKCSLLQEFPSHSKTLILRKISVKVR